MLPVEHRLRRSSEFRDAVRRGAHSAQRPLMVVHVSSEGRGASTRVGFVVGRAVGGAVVRNRVRRRLRHLMRDRVEMVPRGSAVVVRALPGAARASGTELAQSLDAALSAAVHGLKRRR